MRKIIYVTLIVALFAMTGCTANNPIKKIEDKASSQFNEVLEGAILSSKINKIKNIIEEEYLGAEILNLRYFPEERYPSVITAEIKHDEETRILDFTNFRKRKLMRFSREMNFAKK